MPPKSVAHATKYVARASKTRGTCPKICGKCHENLGHINDARVVKCFKRSFANVSELYINQVFVRDFVFVVRKR